jgi:protein-L-isoaspartate(D-aspartate) O-methyltransferase
MDATEAREQMVRSQIEGRGIRNHRVLAAMSRIPRERFVLPEDRRRAYDDSPQPIGHGATISQPYIVALMTEALDPMPGERILEVGTGSGYQSAILADLGAEVYTVEIIRALSERAAGLLADLGYPARCRVGNGRQGWPEAAPFDGILVTAAPDDVPGTLVEQLRPGGRLVLPVGRFSQELVLIRRTPSVLQRKYLTAVRFVPLVGEVPHDDPVH